MIAVGMRRAAAPPRSSRGGARLAAAAFLLLLGPSLPVVGQAISAAADATRLSFAPGATRLSVYGLLGAAGGARYVIDLGAGQPLIAHVASPGGAAVVQVFDAASGEPLPGSAQGSAAVQALVPHSGDYLLRVDAPDGSAVRFALQIEVPALVRFGAGGVAAIRAGRFPYSDSSGTTPVDYFIGVESGQTLLVDLSSRSRAFLTVSDFDSGAPLVQSNLSSMNQQAALHAQSNARYIVSAELDRGSALGYRLDMVVPAVSIPAEPVYARFIGPDRIVVVSANGSSSGGRRVTVQSSIDNGTTWRTAAFSADGEVAGVDFPDAADGYLSVSARGRERGPYLYATSDGGANWSPLELPLPTDVDAGLVASVAPTTPRFSDRAHGSISVRISRSDGSSSSYPYTTSDGGRTWQIFPETPVVDVPGAVATQSALEGCLSDYSISGASGGLSASERFGGKTIGEWSTEIRSLLPMPALVYNASISPDGTRIVFTNLTCRTASPGSDSAIPTVTTIYVVADAQGHVSYLRDSGGRQYFDGSMGGNAEYVYDVAGWLSDSATVLAYAPAIPTGAGGSLAPTYWTSVPVAGRAAAVFQSVYRYFLAKGNSLLFYEGPGGGGTAYEIHEVETETGADRVIHSVSQDQNLNITGLSESPDGKIELQYTVDGGSPQTLTAVRR